MKIIDPFDFSGKPGLSDLSLLLLRLSFGSLLLLGHGLGKFHRLFGGEEVKFMNFLGLGATTSLALVVFAEVLCPVLIILGLLTRLATIPIMIMTLVLIFWVHVSDPLNKLELPILLLTAFLVIFVHGAGRYSIDNKLRK